MDKLHLLFDAMNKPGSHTDSELHTLLHDPDLQDILKTAGTLKASTYKPSEPDIDEEWDRFRLRYDIKKCTFIHFMKRHTAAAIAVGAFSLCAIGAAVSISLTSERNANAMVTAATSTSELMDDADAAIAAKSPTDTVYVKANEGETVVFEESTLDEIMEALSRHYGVTVRYKDPHKRNIRIHFNWNKGMTLRETAELLNSFNQLSIHIKDNTIIIE